MLCSNCQKDIAEGSRFCYNCGARQPETGTPAAPPAYAPPKKLVRSSNDRKIAGVCAGLANYFDLDPTIIRVIWLLAIFFGGTGLLAYIILWIVLPMAPTGVPMAAPGSAARV